MICGNRFLYQFSVGVGTEDDYMSIIMRQYFREVYREGNTYKS